MDRVDDAAMDEETSTASAASQSYGFGLVGIRSPSEVAAA